MFGIVKGVLSYPEVMVIEFIL